MSSLALRSLGARKLRAALTSLAIVLGVMMVAGTYILTDTINSSFDDDLHQVERGHRRRRHQGRRRSTRTTAREPPFSASCCRRCERRDGVAAAAGGDLRPAGRRSSAPTASRAAATAPPAFGFSVVAGALRPARLRRRAARRPPTTRSRSTRRPPTTRASRSATRSRIAGKEASREYKLVGIATLGGADSFGGATLVAASPCPRRSGSPASGASSTRSSSPPTTGRRRASSAANLEVVRCRASVEVETGERERAVAKGRHRRVHRLPEDGAARLRRRLAVRRRVPDLQHLLDHRRPAHPRVRAAAHARRQPPPDRQLGRARGVRDRACSPRSSGCWPGSASRRRSTALFKSASASTCRRRAA